MARLFIAYGLVILSTVASAQSLDLRILEKINPSNPSSDYWRATTTSANVIAVAAPAYLLLNGLITHDNVNKKAAVELVISQVISIAITESLKAAINRARPAQAHPDLIFPYMDYNGKSFPSGHTSIAFATATSLSLQFKKWYVVVPSLLWAASVGYSRMYLGVHYPTDVIGGAIVGAGSAFLGHWLNKKIFKKA
jgi:membrane-associated phospholipid phosphatase